MKRLLRTLILLTLAAGIVAAVVWAFLPEPVAVDIATVERGRLRVTVDEDGKTRIRERYTVSAPLVGRLLRIDLEPGDEVKAGETLLARIIPRDPELLDARTVAQAEARVDAAAAALEKIGPLLEQARAAQAHAEEELQRLRRLGRPTVTESELDRAELEAKLRAEDLRSAQIAEEIARFELEQARAALLRARPLESAPPIDITTGENDLANAPNSVGDETVEVQPRTQTEYDQNFLIHSPIDGRVLRVFQESSAVVTAGTPLLELGDPGDLEVVVDVLSQDAVKIQKDDPVVLEHWGGSRPLDARVRIVEPAAKTKISTLGVEEQRVDVIIDLVDPEAEQGHLGDGFRVEARVVVWQEDDVLKVPTSALYRQGNDWAVFRVVEGTARATKLVLGQQNGLEAQVIEGLSEGDQVVIHPSDAVQDGVAIRRR
jgi:HlyD family secretion protein